MIPAMVSKSEKVFLNLGVRQGVRNDGRDCFDFRPVTLETGVLPQAYGSAKVSIGKGIIGGSGGTDVLVSIKAEVMVPTPQRPEEGGVEVSVECAASNFVGCRNRRDLREEVNAELTSTIYSLLSNTIPLRTLCVMPARFAWRLFVDVMVLQNEGNIADAVSFAVWAALQTTRLPRLVGVEAQAGHQDDFTLDSSPENAVLVDAQKVPILITLVGVGGGFILDPNREEEACGSCRLAVAVNACGQYCGAKQMGSLELEPLRIRGLFSCAKAAALSLFGGFEEAKARFGIDTQGKGDFPDAPQGTFGFLA